MNTSTSKPQRVELSFNRFRQQVATINIDITQKDDGSFEYDQVQLQPGHYNYAGIIDGLVNHKYPADKMAAVQNNYLADPEASDAKKEFLDMQSWRQQAKAIAREIFPPEH